MPKPFVSIVIPFFSSREFIREAVDSVLAQTYGDWELILVDDGSTDGSTMLAQEYADRCPDTVRYLEHEGHQHIGMSAARNLGLRNAIGQYIAFLDSNDVWLPHKLEQQVAILESQPQAAMVYGSTQYWYSWTGNPEDLARDYIPDLGVQPDTLVEPPALLTLVHPFGKATAPCLSDLLIRREMIEQIGGFEEDFRAMYQLFGDEAFLAKVYVNEPVFVASNCWAKQRRRPQSEVSLQTQAAQYQTVWLFFLHWLGVYLLEREVKDPGVWSTFHEAVSLYRPSDNLARSRMHMNNTESKWSLRVAGGNEAKLVFSPNRIDTMRIDIKKAVTDASFDIQLNQSRLKVKAHPYLLQFQARADSPRSVYVGAAKAHEPWTGLGLYTKIEVTPEWQNFEKEFVAPSEDDNARILFDVGDSDIPVELSSVRLRSIPDGEVIDPDLTLLLPIDCYYIEQFFARYADDIRGGVLESWDNTYTRKFGGDRVTKSDVLCVEEDNPKATLVGDLTRALHIPSDSFDCILLIQTLQSVQDVRAAINTLHRILKPGGVVLATFPGVCQTYTPDWGRHWNWNLTPLSAERLFEEAFSKTNVKTEAFGNVPAMIAFLHGLAREELSLEELSYYEPGYEVTIAVKAVKTMGS